MSDEKSKTAAALLEEIQSLMELQGENPFKIRAFEKAARAVESVQDLEERAHAGTLTEIAGIGKGIAEVLTEFFLKNQCTLRDELKKDLPPGLLELTKIPGLGPKKARAIIDELDIHTISELEYACRENRLMKLKGFGEKAQQKVLEGILFLNSTRGLVRADEVESVVAKTIQTLRKLAGTRVEETGALRRKLEILDRLEFLVELPVDSKRAAKIKTACESQKWESPTPVQIQFAEQADFEWEWARTTATDEHWKALALKSSTEHEHALSEQQIYQSVGLVWIPPEMRETGEEVILARQGKLEKVLQPDQIQGAFHCHTTASDGTASLEQMVVEAKKLGYRYLGISDHSVSAFYAQGLNPDALKKQEKEVHEVQEKHPEIRIFWGVESDILVDGSLDYEEKVLKRFDFVIASIHSRFGMGRDEMTARLVRAIQNPYTSFVGHLTGRLLLGRKPYEMDLEKVVQEASKHQVAIEINAHPARLDIDWRAGALLRRHQTWVSINPDAHDLEGLTHTRYGVTVARKALLPAKQVLNTMSAQEVEQWLKK